MQEKESKISKCAPNNIESIQKSFDQFESSWARSLHEALIAIFFYFRGLNFFLQLHLVYWVKGSSERSKAM